MRDRKAGPGGEMGRNESKEGETIIRMYCRRKESIFNERGKGGQKGHEILTYALMWMNLESIILGKNKLITKRHLFGFHREDT